MCEGELFLEFLNFEDSTLQTAVCTRSAECSCGSVVCGASRPKSADLWQDPPGQPTPHSARAALARAAWICLDCWAAQSWGRASLASGSHCSCRVARCMKRTVVLGAVEHDCPLSAGPGFSSRAHQRGRRGPDQESTSQGSWHLERSWSWRLERLSLAADRGSPRL